MDLSTIIMCLFLALEFSSANFRHKKNKPPKGFQYLGQFKQKEYYEGGSSGFSQINYYMSTKEADWNIARDNCSTAFPPNGHIVSLESKEEWTFIRKQLANYDYGMTYWTSGDYNKWDGKFYWFDGSIVKGWAPWGLNQPPPNLPPYHKIAIVEEGIHGTWEVYPSSRYLRYICESSMESAVIFQTTTEDSELIPLDEITMYEGDGPALYETEMEEIALTNGTEAPIITEKPTTSTTTTTQEPTTEMLSTSSTTPTTAKPTLIPLKRCLTLEGSPNSVALHLLIKLDSRKIYYSTMEINWEMALDFCNYHNLELAEIYNVEEHDAVAQALSSMMAINGSSYWVGSNVIDKRKTKEFHWRCRGERIIEELWGQNPEKITNSSSKPYYESCVHITKDRLGYATCREKQRFLCQNNFLFPHLPE